MYFFTNNILSKKKTIFEKKKFIFFIFIFVIIFNENILAEDKSNSKFISDKLRFGTSISFGPSTARYALTGKLREKYKNLFRNGLTLNNDSNINITTRFPINFEIFLGLRPIKIIAFDLIFGVTKPFGSKLNFNIGSENKLKNNIEYKFNHINITLKSILFQGRFYEGIGVRFKNLIYSKIESQSNSDLENEINQKIKNNEDRKNAKKSLKNFFGNNYKGKKININKMKFSKWSISFIGLIGYEFNFGLILELNLEFDLGLLKIVKLSNRSSSKLFIINDPLLIKSIETINQPILYFTLGYNFGRLLNF